MHNVYSAQISVEVSRRNQVFAVAFQDQSPGAEDQPAPGLPLVIQPPDLSISSFVTEFRNECLGSDASKMVGFKTLFLNWRDLFDELPANRNGLSSEVDKASFTALRALVQIMEGDLDDLELREQLYPEYRKLLCSLYKTKFISDVNSYKTTVRFQVYPEDVLEIELEGVVEVGAISFEQWWEAIKNICDDETQGSSGRANGPPRTHSNDSDKRKLGAILHHAIRFATGLNVRPPQERNAFAAFLEAYCDFAQRRPDAIAALQIPLAPIYTSIAVLEDDPWEEREYITRVFTNERDVSRRDRALGRLLQHAADNASTDGPKSKRLAFAAAEQYLRMYSIERALDALAVAPNPGWGLELLLNAYRNLRISLPALAILLAVIVWGSHRWPQLTIPIVVIASICAMSGVLGMILRGNTTPIRLLFPRLFGAITVGTAILLVDDLPSKWNWEHLGLTSIAIGGLAYLGALVYLYLEVESVLKQTPESQRGNDNAQGNAVIRYTALALFAIGVAEAFVIATIALALFAPLFGTQVETSWWILTWPLVTLDLSKILLWAGAALFLGAFLQLLWQERRVTSVQ